MFKLNDKKQIQRQAAVISGIAESKCLEGANKWDSGGCVFFIQ